MSDNGLRLRLVYDVWVVATCNQKQASIFCLLREYANNISENKEKNVQNMSAFVSVARIPMSSDVCCILRLLLLYI